MNRVGAASVVILSCVAIGRAAGAQEPPPRIGPFVVDLQGTVPAFGDDPLLAQSRGLSQAELPGPGLGVSVGVHVYPARLGPVTFGVGGEATVGRAHAVPVAADQSGLRRVTETFKSIAPVVSLNFGNGHGWSYLSIGVGRSIWSIAPDGAPATPADREVLSTIDYGGGARWFAKKHLAFSLGVRLYEIHAGALQADLPGGPRTVLLVVGAGVSLK